VTGPLQESLVEHAATKGLDRPGLASRVLVELEREVGLRPIRTSRCMVVEIPSDVSEDEAFALIPEGAAVAVLGVEADPLVEEIQEAVRQGDSSGLKRVATELDKIGDDFDQKIARAVAAGADQPEKLELDFRARDLPTLTDIRYKDKTLVNFFAVTEDFRVNFQLFAYNGGFLDHEAFSLIEHYKSDSDPRLTCILILRPPQLSELEAQALELVPPELSEGNISSSLIAIIPAVVAFVTAVAARKVVQKVAEAALVAAVAWAVEKGLNKLIGNAPRLERIITAESAREALDELPPGASARQLLETRRQLVLLGPEGQRRTD
jgi:hypothetical protein